MGDDFDDFEGGEVEEDFGDFDGGFNDDAAVADDKGTDQIAVNPSQSLLASEVVSNYILDIVHTSMFSPD